MNASCRASLTDAVVLAIHAEVLEALVKRGVGLKTCTIGSSSSVASHHNVLDCFSNAGEVKLVDAQLVNASCSASLTHAVILAARAKFT